MGSPSLQLTLVFLLTSIVGMLMLLKGLSTRALERRFVRCRACGGGVGRGCACGRG